MEEQNLYYPLKKTQLSAILSMLNTIDNNCGTAIFYKNAIYPVTINTEDKIIHGYNDKLNGYNLIEDPNNLTMGEDRIYIYDSNNPYLEKLKEHSKRTGLKTLALTEWNDGLTIVIQIDDQEYPILKAIRYNEFQLDLKLYPSFEDKVAELTNKDFMWHHNTPNEILDIIAGNVVSVKEDDNFVRISKNTFPFIGTVKLMDDKAFEYNYCFTTCKNGDPCVIFIVSYKKFKAIHIFNYIQYEKEE